LRRKRLQKPKDSESSGAHFSPAGACGVWGQDDFSILKKWDVDEEVLSGLAGRRTG